MRSISADRLRDRQQDAVGSDPTGGHVMKITRLKSYGYRCNEYTLHRLAGRQVETRKRARKYWYQKYWRFIYLGRASTLLDITFVFLFLSLIFPFLLCICASVYVLTRDCRFLSVSADSSINLKRNFYTMETYLILFVNCRNFLVADSIFPNCIYFKIHTWEMNMYVYIQGVWKRIDSACERVQLGKLNKKVLRNYRKN